MPEPSIFTRIINREIPAHIVYEDERTVAFLSIEPINPGHLLVVPRAQVDKLYNLEDEDYEAVMRTVKRMMRRVAEIIPCERVGLIVKGYGVPHAHVHVVPLLHIDDIRDEPQQDLHPTDQELAETAEKFLVISN